RWSSRRASVAPTSSTATTSRSAARSTTVTPRCTCGMPTRSRAHTRARPDPAARAQRSARQLVRGVVTDDGIARPISFDARYGASVDRALVLGGGGVVFVAWLTAYLHGLVARGVAVGDADRIVGTS